MSTREEKIAAARNFVFSQETAYKYAILIEKLAKIDGWEAQRACLGHCQEFVCSTKTYDLIPNITTVNEVLNVMRDKNEKQHFCLRDTRIIWSAHIKPRVRREKPGITRDFVFSRETAYEFEKWIEKLAYADGWKASRRFASNEELAEPIKFLPLISGKTTINDVLTLMYDKSNGTQDYYFVVVWDDICLQVHTNTMEYTSPTNSRPVKKKQIFFLILVLLRFRIIQITMSFNGLITG